MSDHHRFISEFFASFSLVIIPGVGLGTPDTKMDSEHQTEGRRKVDMGKFMN